MAKAGQAPTPNSPVLAREAFERDLPKALRSRTLGEAGWRRVDELTLLVPLWGERSGAPPDLYLVRLHFGSYPEWPPSVQFVNPITLAYDATVDQMWLPKIEGNPRIQVHAAYNHGGRLLQLVCSSTTLEFYEILHGVNESQVWTEKHCFSATLAELEAGLREANGYRGRLA